MAGLEAALALRHLVGDRVATTMLTPEPDFVYRPLRVREPFSAPAAKHYPLAQIADDIGMELLPDAFKWLDPVARVVHTRTGQQVGYDALLLAMGARLRPRFKHALTLDDRILDEQLHGVVQDIEAGYVHKLAFIVPSPMPWPLPVYELALMTARRAYEMNETVSITIVTPEDAPLAIFGPSVSRAVEQVLREAGISLIVSSHVETPEPGHVVVFPADRTLIVDSIVALPSLFGPSCPGVPKRDAHGFVPVDAQCRVLDLDGVFAAGDATEMAIKHGSVAAHQADVAAQAIAALAGANVESDPSPLEMHAILLGGPKPLYLSAHATGTHGSASLVSAEPDWAVGGKIAARFLAPYLEQRDIVGVH